MLSFPIKFCRRLHDCTSRDCRFIIIKITYSNGGQYDVIMTLTYRRRWAAFCRERSIVWHHHDPDLPTTVSRIYSGKKRSMMSTRRWLTNDGEQHVVEEQRHEDDKENEIARVATALEKHLPLPRWEVLTHHADTSALRADESAFGAEESAFCSDVARWVLTIARSVADVRTPDTAVAQLNSLC